MNQKRQRCYCGNDLIKMSGQDHEGKKPLGYYCKKCDKIFDLDLIPLVSYRAVFHIEPEPRLGIVRDMFPGQWEKVIKKIQENPNVRTLPSEIRYPENTINKSSEKTFDNQVRQNEIAEASKSQEMFLK